MRFFAATCHVVRPADCVARFRPAVRGVVLAGHSLLKVGAKLGGAAVDGAERGKESFLLGVELAWFFLKKTLLPRHFADRLFLELGEAILDGLF